MEEKDGRTSAGIDAAEGGGSMTDDTNSVERVVKDILGPDNCICQYGQDSCYFCSVVFPQREGIAKALRALLTGPSEDALEDNEAHPLYPIYDWGITDGEPDWDKFEQALAESKVRIVAREKALLENRQAAQRCAQRRADDIAQLKARHTELEVEISRLREAVPHCPECQGQNLEWFQDCQETEGRCADCGQALMVVNGAAQLKPVEKENP